MVEYLVDPIAEATLPVVIVSMLPVVLLVTTVFTRALA